MNIPLNVAFYSLAFVCLQAAIFHNFFSENAAGLWTSGKKRYSFDFVGWICLILMAVFTLIWGGVFWW